MNTKDAKTCHECAANNGEWDYKMKECAIGKGSQSIQTFLSAAALCNND